MVLPFGGCELWCIELDSFNDCTSLAIKKFMKDMEQTIRPSYPSLIAIHLNKTTVKKELADKVIKELVDAGNAVSKVAFIGLNYYEKSRIKKSMRNKSITFQYHFNNDYEKAKEWLASLV